MAYRILINDGMDKEGLDILLNRGIDAVSEYRDKEALSGSIGDFDAFLVRSKTTVTREIIQAGAKGRLRMIGRGGVGTDNIDVDAANEYGIVVESAPNGVTNSTAEHTIALMLAVARKIPQSSSTIERGIWTKKPYEGIELEGKNLGVIGCGRIGQTVAQKARALGMNVFGYDANMDSVRERFPDSVMNYIALEEVLELSDFVTLHTGGKAVVIGENELNKMKPNAILINASRGNNVDENALYEALNAQRIYGAGLDTYAKEPKTEGQEVTNTMKKLAGLDNVVMTPHLGASTREGQRRTSVELARVTIDYLFSGDYKNSVNTTKPSDEGRPSYTVCIYHEDVPDMFGKMSHVFGRNRINIRVINSEQIEGDGKVITNYVVHQPVDSSTLDELRKIEGVYRVLFTNPYQ